MGKTSGCFFFQALLVLSVCGYANAIRTYHMEEYCGQTINMITSSFKQASIKFAASGSFSHPSYNPDPENECELALEAWYSWDYIGFYFDLDLDCEFGYFVFEDGDRVMDGLDRVCGDVGQGGQYVATSRTLKIKYVAITKYYENYYNSHAMNLIVTAFHEGHCESYEYECDSGHCIDDDLSCTKYKSCGDDDNCRISSGAIAGIVIGCLAGVGIIVIIIVMVCCCKRQRLPTTTAATGGQVIYMAQAVPAVSINSSQQPPPYALAVNQPLPAGYYSNPGLQQNNIQDVQQKSSNPTV